ncbi:hypothetical protein RD110_04300 [Rhodoferax koreense]|uniref:Glycosyltransferase 2-like domain-containing protein n=1 Tax=Rhodoferax koreensis TaxID=1842727 RepID=A0A1P8JRY9_9BURK|nr:glycosyltransferase [Rhodoferax koreense]APW36522.1 hypothetical protein RD110_04300 [Rhodoferax koreense]
MTRIFDSFIFFNELDLLEIRLNLLAPHVDRFVLVEATRSFQGQPKPLHFADNRQRFAAFLGKIEHVVVDDFPEGASAWDREHFQRDAIMRGLGDCAAEDLVIISDADEIPRPEAIPSELEAGMVALLNQRLFYYRLNMGCVEMSHLPCSAVVQRRDLESPATLRRRIVASHSVMLAQGVAAAAATGPFRIIEDGGWHFSYLGSAQDAVAKIEAFAHDEFNAPQFKDLDAIEDAIDSGRDLLGRSLTFQIVPDTQLPRYVQDHRSALLAKGLLAISNPANTMLFDQYSRYQACADLLKLGGVGDENTVLDIGSGPECLFKRFIPGSQMYFVDPLIPTGTEPACLANDVFSPMLDGRQFDYVTAVDVFEHIAPAQRDPFIDRLSSLCGRGLVIGFPCNDATDAVQVDDHIEKAYRETYGRDYSWLEEHQTYGLPSLARTVTRLETAGWHCQVVGHGHAPWLQTLLTFVINTWETPSLRELALHVSRIFNRDLYRHDFKAPFYRQFIVATRQPLPPLAQHFACAEDGDGEARFHELMDEAHRSLLTKSLHLLEEKQAKVERVQAAHDAALADRDAALAHRDAALAQRDTSLADRDIALADRDTALADRDTALAARNQVQSTLDANQAALQGVLASKSWRLTRPMRVAMRWARYGVDSADLRKLENALKTRVARLPLPAPVRNQLRSAYHGIRRSVRVTQPAAPGLVVLESARPAPRVAGHADYIFWGVIDWHFRHQRPQHLAQAIAATGRRVFYVSAHLADNAGPGFTAEPLDEAGRLFQIRLYVRGAPPIYHRAPDAAVMAQLRASVGELLEWADCGRVISLVQHSFWHGVASVLPNSRLVYDCMDHHEGFGNNDAGILALEQQLLRDADVTIATSAWLAEVLTPRTAHCHIVRNAGDYQHFARIPDTMFRDPGGRKVIGYIGAIAEWFDLELVEKIARRFADCLVLLVGNDSAGAAAHLSNVPNVQFTGELSYKELPFYVHGFDVCLLPFRIIPLTLATNPVKVYEYLGTGKPVVATTLPETQQFGDLIETAATHDAYLDAVARALAADPAMGREARQAFAREQTWRHRAHDIVSLVEAPADEPLVSVIVVTYNNLALTKACLASLDTYTDYPAMEIIVVDNASVDGSPEFLCEWAEGAPNRKLVLNADNLGFAAGNNVGLEIARGEYLILLNNDTHVTPGWMRTLIAHMRRDATIGLIGPVTNNIGNEAKLEIAYDDMTQMLERSAAFTRRHLGVNFGVHTVAFFCVAMPRGVYEKVGPLDEAFGRGFFEDDDYCRRVEQQGLRIVCAEDVFIHHHLSASFNKLKQTDRQALFDQNRVVYEAKWGSWKPHAYRRDRAPMPQNAARRVHAEVPAEFIGCAWTNGQCSVCDRNSRFFQVAGEGGPDGAWVCEYCRASALERRLASALLQWLGESIGVHAQALTRLPAAALGQRVKIGLVDGTAVHAPSLIDALSRISWVERTSTDTPPGVLDLAIGITPPPQTLASTVRSLRAGGTLLVAAPREVAASLARTGEEIADIDLLHAADDLPQAAVQGIDLLQFRRVGA